jgi:hypothetical protein
VILAEGLPVESYLDTGDRGDFHQDSETIRLFADFSGRLAPETALLWETRGAARLVTTGEQLAAARRTVPGWAKPPRPRTSAEAIRRVVPTTAPKPRHAHFSHPRWRIGLNPA